MIGSLAGCGSTPAPLGIEAGATTAAPVASNEPFHVVHDPNQDTDGDGVRDDDDVCPTIAGKRRDGCEELVRIGGHVDPIVIKIVFAPNATALSPEAVGVIADAANVLREHPEIVMLHVIGNTDATEPRADELGRKRAEAVVNALITRGIDRTRLSAESAGATSPMASNDTAEDRARNRRIDFVVDRR